MVVRDRSRTDRRHRLDARGEPGLRLAQAGIEHRQHAVAALWLAGRHHFQQGPVGRIEHVPREDHGELETHGHALHVNGIGCGIR